MKKLLLLGACLLCPGFGIAADMPKKELPPKPIVKAAPVVAPNPFAVGVSLGMALSPTTNVLTIDGQLQGDGPVKGYPIGPLAGIVMTYSLFPIGSAYVDAVLEAHYDFSRGCVGDACQAERKNGFLLQEGLEIGLTALQANSYVPPPVQAANWPLPIMVPASFAQNFKIGVRGGMAERNVSLCAVVDQVGDYGCANQFLWAPYAGVGLGFMASANTEVKAVYDHVFWRQGNSFTPTSAIPLFSSTVAMKQEDNVKLQLLYHLP